MTDTDAIAAARATVAAYLDRSMAGDADGARAFLAPGCEIVFTGGRRMDGPEGPPAFNACRYAWVRKRPPDYVDWPNRGRGGRRARRPN